MNILLVLIPVTLLVIAIAVALFFWAVNHQQFDDLQSPGVLPLMDDPPPYPAHSDELDLAKLPHDAGVVVPGAAVREEAAPAIPARSDPDQG